MSQRAKLEAWKLKKKQLEQNTKDRKQVKATTDENKRPLSKKVDGQSMSASRRGELSPQTKTHETQEHAQDALENAIIIYDKLIRLKYMRNILGRKFKEENNTKLQSCISLADKLETLKDELLQNETKLENIRNEIAGEAQNIALGKFHISDDLHEASSTLETWNKALEECSKRFYIGGSSKSS